MTGFITNVGAKLHTYTPPPSSEYRAQPITTVALAANGVVQDVVGPFSSAEQAERWAQAAGFKVFR